MIQELFDALEKRIWTASMPVACTYMFVMHFLIPGIVVEEIVKSVAVKMREGEND